MRDSNLTPPGAAIDAPAYRLIFDQSPQAMWLYDEKTLAFVEVNRAAVALYGYSRDEFLRMDISQIRPPEEVPSLLEHLERREDSPARIWKHRTKSGRIIDVEVLSSQLVAGDQRIRVVAVRDVSEQRKLEDQWRQAQKMETIGQLAGGVAHDFNNLLTAIIGHAAILSDYFADGDPRAVEVTGIREAADLAASLTRQLLAFSRKQILQPTVLNLNDVVDKTRRILGRLIGAHILLLTEPARSLRCVKADAGQMEQILLNLAVNARDAMPEGGRLSLRTRNVTLGADEARRLDVKEREYVELSVSDTGVGIEPAVRARLFEPFFTTKARGRGTGLGLSTVYGIVKQSGGHIAVESEVGRGTTFSIFLPVSTGVPARHSARKRAALADRGSETVMLVEDDNAVRALIGDVLRRRGYRMLVADGGRQALELASSHVGAIDLLITDVVMPGMGGPAVADAVRAQRAGLKVLYVSGYIDDEMMPSGFLESNAAFLHKPFTPDALARKVRTVLGEPAL